jgi:hypothetical protein
MDGKLRTDGLERPCAAQAGRNNARTMKLTLLSLALMLALPSVLPAADEAKKEPAAPAAEAPAEGELPRVSAADMEGVRKLLGKKAIVYGKVTGTSSNERLGMSWVQMDGEKFTLVTWKDSYAKFPEGQSPAKIYKGAKIEVTGEITEYKPKNGGDGKLQIKLTDPAQIKITEPAAAKDDKKSGAKDKKEK